MTEPLADSLGRLQQEARTAPTDASLRMQLFRVLAALAQWERAATQLDTASSLEPALAMTGIVYKHAIVCERLRQDVFAGRKTPVVLGEPPHWLASMIEALRTTDPAQAKALRDAALEAAPTTPGRLNDQPIEWIADADDRLGPVLEAFLDGRYLWIPFSQVASLKLSEPTDLLDLVWVQAELGLRTGASRPVLIPVRYPGTEHADSEALGLSRRTEWLGSEAFGYVGLGQRELVTDQDQFGLLQLRSLELD